MLLASVLAMLLLLSSMATGFSHKKCRLLISEDILLLDTGYRQTGMEMVMELAMGGVLLWVLWVLRDP